MSTPSLHPYACVDLSTSASASASASAPALRGHTRGPSAGSREELESRPLTEYDPPKPRTPDAPRSSDETKVSPTLPPHGRPHVKHGSGATLLLTGHSLKAEASLPLYQSGSLLSGIAVLDKPARVTSLEIKLEGIVSVREIQGGGRSNVVFFSDQLLTWDTASSCLLDELSFSRVIPAVSHDGRVLLPTFDSRMNGIPGFRVSVRWQVVLTVMRSRTGPLALLRHTIRLCVPIGYMPRTRPPAQGPFPLTPAPSSPPHPCASFVDLVRSRRQNTPPIQTQIYLPSSPIMPMTEPITFRVMLWAPDAYLMPFLAVRPQSSFLPLDGAETAAPGSTGPVRVHVARRIAADASSTFVVVVGPLVTPAARGTVLAEGTLNKPERGEGCVGWWGELRVPLDLVGGGGFVSDRLLVQDELVLTLDVPSMPSHTLPFRQVVPIRFTTDLAETCAAVRITEV